MTTLAPEITPHPLLSQAVVAYLGLGTAASPQRNVQAVEVLGDHDSDLILATRTVINEVLALETDYVFDTAEVEALVAAHTRSVCPDLTDDAVAAIVWNYTLGWR